jgi:hypothetical protein
MDIEHMIERRWQELQAQKLVALQSVQEARAELDAIEVEIENAADGSPFTDISQINGVDASAVFAVMGIRRRIDVSSLEHIRF